MKQIIIFLLVIISFSGLAYAGGKGAAPAAPQVFNFEDLKSAASDYRSSFSFYNEAKPDAEADLPSQAPDGASTGATSVKINQIRAMGGYSFLTFPWGDTNIREGDVFFMRGGDPASQVIRFFSTWTHSAFIYNKGRGESFESQKSKGVNTYNYASAWIKIIAYSVKRVNIGNPMYYVEKAKNSYLGKSYFPSAVEAARGIPYFFRKWSDKNDLDSIYCSKLIWLTFKDFGVDLDSERTTSYNFGTSAGMDIGGGSANRSAWIGVSPDDIYYSRKMSKDILIAGKDKLGYPLADSVF